MEQNIADLSECTALKWTPRFAALFSLQEPGLIRTGNHASGWGNPVGMRLAHAVQAVCRYAIESLHGGVSADATRHLHDSLHDIMRMIALRDEGPEPCLRLLDKLWYACRAEASIQKNPDRFYVFHTFKTHDDFRKAADCRINALPALPAAHDMRHIALMTRARTAFAEAQVALHSLRVRNARRGSVMLRRLDLLPDMIHGADA